MLAHVTNLAASPRGFDTPGGIVLVDPGDTVLVDLADHPAHHAWEAAGEITLAPLSDKDARAMRKRMEARVEAEARMQVEALERLSRGPSPVATGDDVTAKP